MSEKIGWPHEAVPGGWLVHVECETIVNPDSADGYYRVVRPVFVPAPPRLVRLESVSGVECLMGPSIILSKSDDPQLPGTYVEWQGAACFVKGTPDEVAAKLGLEIVPDPPLPEAPK